MDTIKKGFQKFLKPLLFIDLSICLRLSVRYFTRGGIGINQGDIGHRDAA
jgi:hypothetical protein